MDQNFYILRKTNTEHKKHIALGDVRFVLVYLKYIN